MRINMEKNSYKHKILETVKFHEVDMLGVCNNAVYLNYFEDARIKYVQDLKRKFGLKKLLENDSFFIMVHNEIDYVESAHLDDELWIYTKVEFIKKTSFGFRHIVEKKSNGKIIARGGGVVVHINKKERTPIPLPQEFYDAVNNLDPQVKILKSDN